MSSPPTRGNFSVNAMSLLDMWTRIYLASGPQQHKRPPPPPPTTPT